MIYAQTVKCYKWNIVYTVCGYVGVDKISLAGHTYSAEAMYKLNILSIVSF